MRRLLHLGAVAFLAVTGLLVWRYGETILSLAVTSAMPDPQDGKVTGRVYTNAYFDLSYPLPPGFAEGLAEPRPSQSRPHPPRALAAHALRARPLLPSAPGTPFPNG